MTERYHSDRCPVCLGSGIERIPDYDKVGGFTARRKLIPARWIESKCFACHGKGTRPQWMSDDRHNGIPFDPTFDYVKAQ